MHGNWQRLEEIFDQICSLDENGRAEILDERCSGEDDLRSEALRLAHAYDAERSANADANSPRKGMRFGVWETIQLVGRGGMGEVWLARRADGQHEQRAALKILSPYLAAPDSLDRFRRERQLLARLEHPNIARLLDGGMSARGEPYLVMEYVDGMRLDRYCDQHRLSIRHRLALMIKICAAVNSAHQYLVVHRDLKPGNILVTANGEPKLLDFGIAKVIDGESGREQTATANLFLTPTYASPETLRGEAATVASDVYSLGVVLYELVTGSRPFAMGDGSSAADLERAFREVRPARAMQLSNTAAEQRSTTAARMRQLLEGELSTILDKALRHEASQRYRSAEHLAADLDRYIANRPILARPPTLRYRLSKFVSRNRWQVGLAAVALVGIALGIASTMTEKQVAQRRFEDVRRLAHYVLFDLYDDVSNLSGSAKVRAEMANRATDYLNTLSREAKGDRGLRLELAEGYLRLGDIQGNMFRTNLGDKKAALVTYQKGLDLLDPLKNDPGAIRMRTEIQLHQAQATDAQTATKEAFDRLRAAVERFEKLAGPQPSIEDQYQLGQAYELVGALAQQHGGWVSMSNVSSGELQRAESYLRRVVELRPADPAYTYSLAELLDRRAMAYASLEPQRAIGYDQQALDSLHRVPEPNRGYPSFRILMARVHTDLIFAYGQLNQFDTALEHARVAEQIYMPLVAASPEDHDVRYRLVLRRVAGIVEAYAKHWTESANQFAKGIADYDILLETGPNAQYRAYQAELRMRMADDLWEAGRKPEAEAAARAGLAEFRELTHSPDAKFPLLRQAAGYLLFTEVRNLRNPREALNLAERCRNNPADPFPVYELLAAAYAENHRYREAAETARRALNALPPVKPGQPPSRARQSTEKSLADYQHKAQAVRQ